MTDIPNDDPPAPEGEGDKPEAGSSGSTPWQPATDAGRAEPSSETNASKAGAARKASAAKASASPRRPAPTGDEALRRRPESPPAAEPQPEPEGEASPDLETPETFAGERIAKAIARAGLASRRDAEAMILAGRVSVNGEVIASPALNVTDEDRIAVDGEPLPTRERTRLWIFHKPRGLVTTARDPEGRQTVFEVLPEDMPRVVAVGRLDINTEGLLLLTNDGGLAKVIAHPDTGWLRRYRVRAHGDTDQAQLDRLAKGVTIDGMEYGPVEATLDRVQ
ncbi:MAG: rRNA pseudouridine synthase, partial [Parafilimonas terrae]|nr:rRNA pseudouridine synthase [Parafilimonas terrae]